MNAMSNVIYAIMERGINEYLLLNGDRIENVGEALFEHNETSVLLNCYVDDAGNYAPIFEFENNGHLTQFDNLADAYEAFKENGGR